MVRYIPLSIAVILLPWCSSAQMVIDGSATAEQLVQTLVGPGVDVSNITQPINFTWPDDGPPYDVWTGSASFTANGINLGMQAGIILSTGPVMYAAPWSPTPLSTQCIWTDGDDDLTVLSGGTVGSPYAITKEASVLEFDFVPTGDSVKFRYVFASNEYPEWVCSQFNDVFGFFLSGPGINGPFSNNSVNLAVIPGTNIPITVNSVNSGEVGGITFPYPASTCAETDPNWQNNSIYYVDNEFGPDIYYDGFTVVLEAAAAVVCGETYHIKLAIADNVDRFYDSAVFLEAGSFTSTGNSVSVSLVPGMGISGDTLTEGCPIEFLIQRNGDPSTAATFDLMVGGTATSGVDYDPPLPATITFAAGESQQSLFINVPMDPDGPETIILDIMGNACNDADENDLIFIIDSPPPLDVTLVDAVAGCGGEVELEPQVMGGHGLYEYQWSDGSMDTTLVVMPDGPTEVELVVSDGCGVEDVTVTAEVSVDADPIEIVLPQDLELPCGEAMEVSPVNVTGGDGDYQYTWSQNGTTHSNTAGVTVQAAQPSWFLLQVIDGCGTTAIDSILVSPQQVTGLEMNMAPQPVLPCDGETQVSVLEVSGGIPPYMYDWSNAGSPIGNVSSITVAATGWYVVAVSDACGGIAVDSVQVLPADPSDLQLIVDPTAVLPCMEQVALEVEAVTGGMEPYTYDWSLNGNSLGSETTVMASQTGWYIVHVTDACGGSVTDSIQVLPADPSELQLIVDPTAVLPCLEQVALEVEAVTGGVEPYTYDWSLNGSSLGSETAVMASQTGWYNVLVTDACGGSVTDSIQVLPADPSDLQLIVDPTAVLPCLEQVALEVEAVTGGFEPYTFDWSFNGSSMGSETAVMASQTGWYNVLVTDACGGSAIDSVMVMSEVIEPLLVEVTPATEIICDEQIHLEVLQVSGGIGPYRYQWSLEGTVLGSDAFLEVNIPGNYEVIVSATCGGSANELVQVTSGSDGPLLLEVSPETFVPCNGDAQIGVLNVSGGTGSPVCQWSFNGINVGSTLDIVVMDAGWYHVQVTDECGAVAMDSVIVSHTTYEPMMVITGPDLALPCMQQGEISVAGVTGGDGTFAIEWSLNGSTVGTGNTLLVNAGPPQWYVVTATDGCGATGVDSVLVTEQEPGLLDVQANLVGDILCPGDAVTLQAAPVMGAVEPVTFTWEFPGGGVAGTGPEMEVMTVVPQELLLVVVDACGIPASTRF